MNVENLYLIIWGVDGYACSLRARTLAVGAGLRLLEYEC